MQNIPQLTSSSPLALFAFKRTASLFLLVFFFSLPGKSQTISQLYSSEKWDKITSYLSSADSLKSEEQALLAFTLLRLQRLEASEKVFILAEKNGAGGTRFYRQYAQLYLLQKDPMAALKVLKKGLNQSPQSTELMHDAAAIYYAEEMWVDAERVLRRLLKKKPNNPRYTAMLGNVMLEKDEPLAALQIYEAYLPNLGNTEFDRDILWDCARISRYRLSDLAAAEKYLDMLEIHFPEFWEARQELVQINILRKKYLSAERLMERARQEFLQGKLPPAWQKSGYWMIDIIDLQEHRLHVYTRLSKDKKSPDFKIFILDPGQQHVRGKAEIFRIDASNYSLSLSTNLKSEEFRCDECTDYANLRNCIRKSLAIMDR